MKEINEPFNVAIALSEDYEEYDIDAYITWHIRRVDFKNNKCIIRAERIQEDNSASEIYFNNTQCSNYLLKTSETFDLCISTKDIERALKKDDDIRVKIRKCKYVNGEILEAVYESGKKLTKEELKKNSLGKFDYTNETMILTVMML